jgi:hypothetical protein
MYYGADWFFIAFSIYLKFKVKDILCSIALSLREKYYLIINGFKDYSFYG